MCSLSAPLRYQTVPPSASSILHYCCHPYLLIRVSTWRNKELSNCIQTITFQISKHWVLPDTSSLGIFLCSHYCLETKVAGSGSCLLQWRDEESSSTSCRSTLYLLAGCPRSSQILLLPFLFLLAQVLKVQFLWGVESSLLLRDHDQKREDFRAVHSCNRHRICLH